MAKVQDLLEAAKGAIISGACDQAITLCEHLLQQYPKHLEAHCMLAEAYREHGDLPTAEDLFLRSLSADPERLIARWALSIIYDRRGERDAALKQLHIALELSPDHTELRRELAEMSQDKLKPSTGGLARLYLRGGLFDRSAAEFRAALEREPSRLDLKVGLAEVLWRDGYLDEALRQCHDILEDSPDCLKALAIAAIVEAGKPKSSQLEPLLRSARDLDPEDVLLSDLAKQCNVDVARLELSQEPVIVPDPDNVDAYSTFLPENAAVEAPLVVDDIVPIAQPVATVPLADSHLPEYSARTVEEPKSIRLEDDPCADLPKGDVVQPTDVAALPLTPAPSQMMPLAADVPTWLATDLPASADTKGTAEEWGEWASLLDEQITLDPDAEARLSAALLEVPSSDSTESGSRAATPNPSGLGNLGKQADSSELDALLSAVEANPGNYDARLALAAGYLQAGRIDASTAEYRALLVAAPQLSSQIADGLQDVVRLHSRSPEAHRALGDAFMKIGRFQQAIDEYNQAVALKA